MLPIIPRQVLSYVLVLASQLTFLTVIRRVLQVTARIIQVWI